MLVRRSQRYLVGVRPSADYSAQGIYNACHAEKQLLAFAFLWDEYRNPLVLHVSSKPCTDCERFIKTYARVVGVAVEVFVSGVRVDLQ